MIDQKYWVVFWEEMKTQISAHFTDLKVVNLMGSLLH